MPLTSIKPETTSMFLKIDNMFYSLGAREAVAFVLFCIHRTEYIIPKELRGWAADWINNENKARLHNMSHAVGSASGLSKGVYNILYHTTRAARYVTSSTTRTAHTLTYGDIDAAYQGLKDIAFGTVCCVAYDYFICPWCCRGPAEHLEKGKCIFGPYTWTCIEFAFDIDKTKEYV